MSNVVEFTRGVARPTAEGTRQTLTESDGKECMSRYRGTAADVKRDLSAHGIGMPQVPALAGDHRRPGGAVKMCVN